MQCHVTGSKAGFRTGSASHRQPTSHLSIRYPSGFKRDTEKQSIGTSPFWFGKSGMTKNHVFLSPQFSYSHGSMIIVAAIVVLLTTHSLQRLYLKVDSQPSHYCPDVMVIFV